MSKELSVSEVQSHNAEGNAWIIIDDGVYDISKFAPLHPGGKGVILGVAGQDASEQFHQFHNKAVLKKYEKRLRIGSVKGSTKKETPKAESSGQQGKREEAASKQVQQSKQAATTPAKLEDRVFGDLTPYGDPSWYQGWYSPYYNDSHRKWRKFLRDFVQEHLEGNMYQWDEAKSIPAEIRKKCGEAGLLAAGCEDGFKFTDIKPGYGVIDAKEYDAFHALIFQEEIGKLGSAVFTWGLTGGLSIGLPPVLKFFQNKELQQKVARACLSGQQGICLAITEPSAGSDVANLKTTAKLSEDGKHYIVNGEKKWITNGVTSDWFTTAVRTGGAAHGGVSMLLIPRTEGVTTKQMQCQGVWMSGTTYVTFENVKVPVDHLIGKENQGFKYVMYNFNQERLGSASGATVFSRVLVEEAMKYAHKRKTFGKRLIDHPVIRLKLAHMARQVESLHAWLENVTYQVSQMSHQEAVVKLGGPIALIKGHASIVMEYCAREAAQIFGGLAYTRGGQGEKVERLYREVRAYAIPAGSEEIMFDLAVRQSMKQYQSLKSKH